LAETIGRGTGKGKQRNIGIMECWNDGIMGHIETLDLGRRSVPRGVVASLLHRGLEDRPSALRI
jgi:dihydroxyacid dehydratase/phosphogluconate dehydratase